LTNPLTVGEKRNLAASLAPESATVFAIMDDDDHYPAHSLAIRVAWLMTTKMECVYCSTIPMYDCTRYISAVNVPPLILSAAERVSEATLCFTRQFWESNNFPAVSMAEGEGFVIGREHKTVEIPPNGVIVSFIHGKNASSRRVPVENEPNGCHYGFDDDYFSYLTRLGMAA
jgi:hypothetical protein